MLVRRGFHAVAARPDIPFPEEMEQEAARTLVGQLGHYGFRLFLRGAIQKGEGFRPRETTRYLTAAQAGEYAETLVHLGLAGRLERGRYRLLQQARSFGGTLEWYVARELRRRYDFDVASGVKIDAPGVGGDLDVVASAEGKLLYLELKSSPPKNLASAEVTAFFDRLQVLRPDAALFVVDTALRLSDKILPMLLAEIERRRNGSPPAPRRLEQELWAITPHLYAVNGRRDLMMNIGRALAESLLSLSPRYP